MSHSSPPQTPNLRPTYIPNTDIPSFVLNNVQKFRDTTKSRDVICIDGDTGVSMSFKTMKSLVDGIAYGLVRNLGLRKGNVVAIYSPNTLQCPALMLAILRAGCVVTFVDYKSSPSELEDHLKSTDVKAVFSHHQLMAKLINTVIEKNVGIQQENIVVMSPQSLSTRNPCVLDLITPGSRLQPEVTLSSASCVIDEVPAILNYSPGGTNGNGSKNELLSHNHIISFLTQTLESSRCSGSDIENQQFHLKQTGNNDNNLIETMLLGLCSGGQLVISQTCCLRNITRLVSQYEIGLLYIESPKSTSASNPAIRQMLHSAMNSGMRTRSTRRVLICSDVFRPKL